MNNELWPNECELGLVCLINALHTYQLLKPNQSLDVARAWITRAMPYYSLR